MDTTGERKFSEVAFEFDRAESGFTERLFELTGYTWEDLGRDEYDNSLEIYKCQPDMRLSKESQEFLFGHGFGIVYLNHTDGWNTFYRTPGSDNPWRRREKEGGGYEINYMPKSWEPVGEEWLSTGYIEVVPGEAGKGGEV